VAKITTLFPWNILWFAIVTAVSVSVSVAVLQMKTTDDLEQDIPTGDKLFTLQQELTGAFSSRTMPYNILLMPKDTSVAVLSAPFFQAVAKMLAAVEHEIITQMPEAKESEFNFLPYQTGRQPIPFQALQALCGIPRAETASVQEPIAERQLSSTVSDMCHFMLDTQTSTENYLLFDPEAMTGTLTALGIEVLGERGFVFLDTVRDAFAKHAPHYGVKYSIGGMGPYFLDMVTVVYAYLPAMAAGTIVVSVIFVGIAFRSVIIPLRSIVSNSLSLGFTYGLAVHVYQYGALDFLGIRNLSGDYHALPWIVPVVQFFCLIGICLDYDIFLLTRVTEYRAQGMDPRVAIRKGVVSTGGIITAAGVVMAIAFGALVTSSLMQLAVMGFALVVAVLYDTFIVRSIVNPALMSLLGRWNWWPGELSKPHYGFDEDPDLAGTASALSMQTC